MLREIPEIMSYSQVRNNFKAVMDKVWDDAMPIVVTRAGGRPIVMMSKEDYDSISATEYLMSTKANREAMAESLKQVEEGKFGLVFTAGEWKAHRKQGTLPKTKRKAKRRGS
jgi:antitoxin YefM